MIDNNDPLMQVTLALKSLKEFPIAEILLETFGRHSYTFEQFDQIANCFFKLKLYNEAIRYAEQAEITGYTNQKKYTARANLINLYNHANFPEKAMRYIRMNETVIPGDVDTQLEKAFSLFLLNRKSEAEQVLLAHLDNPDISEESRTKIRFNLGTYKMYRDEFLEGLTLFLFEGRKLEYWKKPSLPFIFWDGEIKPGKTIIIMAEAGIGDEFINVRFMNHFKKLGMNPIWLTERKDMADVFNRNGFDAITDLKRFNKDDELYWTHSMDVPVYLKLEYKDLWYGPYLTSNPDIKFDFGSGVKVGVRWQGNPEYDHDLHRSVPLAGIYEVLKDFDVNLFSLQRDVGLEEVGNFPIIDLNNEMKNWENTLAIINTLDIVITTCTSVAHAAAAMGKRTFVFVPISAYYVWTHSMEQSPWYGDNVTILRQDAPRVWDNPLKELRIHLEQEL